MSLSQWGHLEYREIELRLSFVNPLLIKSFFIDQIKRRQFFIFCLRIHDKQLESDYALHNT